jgi:hypothetical protein
MEEDCGGGQGLSWAVKPGGGGEREEELNTESVMEFVANCTANWRKRVLRMPHLITFHILRYQSKGRICLGKPSRCWKGTPTRDQADIKVRTVKIFKRKKCEINHFEFLQKYWDPF